MHAQWALQKGPFALAPDRCCCAGMLMIYLFWVFLREAKKKSNLLYEIF